MAGADVRTLHTEMRASSHCDAGLGQAVSNRIGYVQIFVQVVETPFRNDVKIKEQVECFIIIRCRLLNAPQCG